MKFFVDIIIISPPMYTTTINTVVPQFSLPLTDPNSVGIVTKLKDNFRQVTRGPEAEGEPDRPESGLPREGEREPEEGDGVRQHRPGQAEDRGGHPPAEAGQV